MDDYVDPIIAHVETVREWPQMKASDAAADAAADYKPLFILGHSMGGLITLFTVFKKEALFKVRKKNHF